ncbi:MAG: RNA methyltransferase, partial [Bacteroidetes bacterium]|nr:RNA methyltransferase [Candidatus Cryptobacteroides avistercoris]
MLTNAEIKSIRSLREKKFRDELGLFTVEGEKSVAEALASSFEVVRVLRAEDIGASAMERISQCATPSPVLAVVRMPKEDR